jgi:hypothetical protein
MNKRIKPLYLCFAILLLLIAGIAKFYHYNYIANTRGQARTLRLPGLTEFVCKDLPRHPLGNLDHCGRRSIYADDDWGVTAYTIIFGIETKEEAQAIADFMVEARKKSKQEHIPMNLTVYSLSRSEEGYTAFYKSKIFDQDL